MSKENLSIEDLQDYIDIKSKKQNLDTALLFFTSALGLWFTIIHMFFGELALLYFLPTLFIGWFMPIYIGFIRGSLTLDLVKERIRGWLYFITGVGLYALVIILDYYPLTRGAEYLLVVPLVMFIVIFSFVITPKLLKVFGQVLTLQIIFSFVFTVASAVSIATFIFSLININNIHIVICIIASVIAICFEIMARKFVVCS